MKNPFINGWLAEQERSDRLTLFGDPGDNLQIVSEADAMTKIKESAQRPVTTHPWTMAEVLNETHEVPYKRLTTFNQDANNCAGHGASKAIDAFMLFSKWIRTCHAGRKTARRSPANATEVAGFRGVPVG